MRIIHVEDAARKRVGLGRRLETVTNLTVQTGKSRSEAHRLVHGHGDVVAREEIHTAEMLAETFAVRATLERTIDDAPTDDARLARERGQGGDSPRSRKSSRARARERARRRRRVTREYAAGQNEEHGTKTNNTEKQNHGTRVFFVLFVFRRVVVFFVALLVCRHVVTFESHCSFFPRVVIFSVALLVFSRFRV